MTTEVMTIHNNQSSIKRIYMTLKCMCVFLLFPLCFFSWRPKKNKVLPPMFYLINIDSVTTYVYFMTADKKRQLPLVFFFMTTNKKPQCYPLCFFSWRPIKNNSVTPYILFDKDNSVTPCVFFHDDQSKTTVLPLMVFFMTTKEKWQCHPSCFIW